MSKNPDGIKKKKEKKGPDLNKMAHHAANKLKKMRKHVRKHPHDLAGASALKAISNGGSGPVPVFPVSRYTPDKHKADGLHDLDVEYRKHHVVYNKGADGRRHKVIVLDESVASGPILWVESEGKVLCVTTNPEEAEAAFNHSHHSCLILQRSGYRIKALKNKRAAPLIRPIDIYKAFAG